MTEAARNFAEYINRIRYQGMTYLLLKNGSPVARMVPVASAKATGRRKAEHKPQYSLEELRRRFLQW